MSRLIFIFIAIALVYWLLKKTYRQSIEKDDKPEATEQMVLCVECGIHIPKSDSWSARGNYFCCEEHQRKYTASH